MCDPLHLPLVKVTLSEKITLIQNVYIPGQISKINILSYEVLICGRLSSFQFFHFLGKKSFYCFSNIAINVSLLVVDRQTLFITGLVADLQESLLVKRMAPTPAGRPCSFFFLHWITCHVLLYVSPSFNTCFTSISILDCLQARLFGVTREYQADPPVRAGKLAIFSGS